MKPLLRAATSPFFSPRDFVPTACDTVGTGLNNVTQSLMCSKQTLSDTPQLESFMYNASFTCVKLTDISQHSDLAE